MKKFLIEVEILKMSDKDYMNEDQFVFFKNWFEQLQVDIFKNVGQMIENLCEMVIVFDFVDCVMIEEEYVFELCMCDCECKFFKKVQQLFVCIDFGDYGWCEEIGELIGILCLFVCLIVMLLFEVQECCELCQKLFGD